MSSGPGLAHERSSRELVADGPGRAPALEQEQGSLRSALRRVHAARSAGASVPPGAAMALQRMMGNRATARALASRRSAGELHAIASDGVGGSPSPLPHLEQIQRSFGGHSVAHVRAFTGPRAAAASRAIGADAYAHGARVAFSRPPSLRTAAHEAAHAVQQDIGVRLQDGVGRAGDAYERHADAVADRVVSGRSAEPLLSALGSPAPARSARAPAIQGAWISRHVDKKELYRFWKQRDDDPFALTDGWYVRKDATGVWDAANVEAGAADKVKALPAAKDILPDPIVSHQTRYDRANLTADAVSEYAQDQIDEQAQKVSALAPELEAKVRRHGGRLKAPKKAYRWGEFKYEKNYVVNNGFSLGNVNFGSKIYGLGMYVADTPWGSAGYATKSDGSIIEITIPAGTFFLNHSKGNTFTAEERTALHQNPRFPQYLQVDDSSGWATIKDDDLDLTIDFYQPEPDELARVAPHLERITDLTGYTAMQIINRQLGNPIPIPDPDEMLTMFINQPEIKRQKVQAYVQDLSKFEFVPFLLSNERLDFADEVGAFIENMPHSATPRYKRHFGYMEPTLMMWANDPFALSGRDFETVIYKPFTAALGRYESDREEKKKQPWYKGHGLKFSGGDKASRLAQFSKRLYEFKGFLELVESKHPGLEEDEKDSHSGIKVGRHFGMLEKGAEEETRRDAIAEAMMRGVPQLPARKTPTAIVMMGFPGAGKSSVLEKVAPDLENYVVADPDDAKEGLPQYQQGLKAKDSSIADTVHPESKRITDHVVAQTMSTRRNLVYDTTGSGIQAKFFEDLTAAGYHIKLVYVHVTFEEAKARVEKRRAQNGRAIPDIIMGNMRMGVPGALGYLAPYADKVEIYNNMGKAPELAWSGDGSEATREKLKEELTNLSA